MVFMATTFECMKCGERGTSIVKKLKCAKCGTEYVYDKKIDLYFFKKTKCAKCHKISETIVSKHVCDKCGAEYVFQKKMGYMEPQLRLKKSKGYAYDRIMTSNFFGDIWVAAITLIIAIIMLSYLGRDDWALLGVIPLLVALYFGYRLFARITKSKFNFKKIIDMPEEKLTKEAKKTKKKGMHYAATHPREFNFAKVGKLLGVIVGAIVVLVIIWLFFGTPLGETVEIKGVQFVAPAGWTIQENPEPGIDLLVSGPSEGGILKPHFSVSRSLTLLPFDMEVDAVVNAILDKGALILEQNDLTVDGYNATEIIFSADHPVSGEPMKGKFIMLNVMGAGDIVIIMFKSKVETYNHNLMIFNQSLATLKIVGSAV